jgi:anaerobic selenocysteine-containing dehydrogenase
MGLDDPEFNLDDEALIRSALVDVDVELLQKQGWVRLDLPEDLRPYANGGYATASGKAELRADGLVSIGQDPLPSYVPSHEGPGGDSDLFGKYPLVLLTPKNHTRFLNSSYSQHHGHFEKGPFVEVDPVDAAARGIGDGDLVSIRNDRATLQLPAQISARLRPGVVAVPWGWWGEEANVNALTNDTLTDWGGGVAYFDTLVEVVRV